MTHAAVFFLSFLALSACNQARRAESPNPPSRPTSTTAVTARHDVDADGLADVAAATSSGVEVYRGTADGFAAPIQIPLAGAVDARVVPDLTGDGRAEIAVLVRTDDGGAALVLDGASLEGAPRERWRAALVRPSERLLRDAGDVNGDGRADALVGDTIVLAAAPGQPLRAHRVTREARRVVPFGDRDLLSVPLGPDDADPLSATTVDVRGAAIHHLDASGRWTETPLDIEPPLGLPFRAVDVAALDLDGDGAPELLVRSEIAPRRTAVHSLGVSAVHVLRRDASGAYAPSRRLGVTEPVAFDAADLDGDGQSEAVLFALRRFGRFTGPVAAWTVGADAIARPLTAAPTAPASVAHRLADVDGRAARVLVDLTEHRARVLSSEARALLTVHEVESHEGTMHYAAELELRDSSGGTFARRSDPAGGLWPLVIEQWPIGARHHLVLGWSSFGGGEETMHALVLEEREGALALVDEVRVSGRRGAFQLVTHQAQGTLYFGVAGDGDVEEDGEPSGRPDDLDLPTGRPLLVPIPSTRTSSPAPVTWVRRVELAR